MNLKHLLAVVLFAVAAILLVNAGLTGYSAYSRYNAAKAQARLVDKALANLGNMPSSESPFQPPVIDGMYQGDTNELLAQWTKAQVKMNAAQKDINEYITLMNAKVKKNGLKEGTTIEFIAQKPCVPADNGMMMCAQGVNVAAPPTPIPTAKKK